MKLEYSIRLDGREYLAGDTIKGCVFLHCYKEVPSLGVMLYFKGREELVVSYRDYDSVMASDVTKKRKHDSYFLQLSKIIKEPKMNQKFCIGEHKISFQLELPKQLPPSFKSKINGTIEYKIASSLTTPTTESFYRETEVILLGTFNPEVYALKPPRSYSSRRAIVHKISLDVHCDKAFYYYGPNQKMLVSVALENRSHREIKGLRVKLKRFFRKSFHSCTNEVFMQIHGTELSQKPNDHKKDSKGIQHFEVQVPLTDLSLLPTFQTSHFSCRYELQVTASISWARDLRVSLPIIIVPRAPLPCLRKNWSKTLIVSSLAQGDEDHGQASELSASSKSSRSALDIPATVDTMTASSISLSSAEDTEDRSKLSGTFALPPGVELVSSGNKKYYVNHNTRTTHWTLAEAVAGFSKSSTRLRELFLSNPQLSEEERCKLLAEDASKEGTVNYNESTPPAYPTLDDSSIELPPGWIVRPNQLGEKCYFNVNTKESSKEDPRSRIVSQTVENREYVVMTKVVVIEGRNLANPVETTFLSDPFCVLRCGGTRRCTSVQKATLDPIWNEEFYFYTDNKPTKILVDIYDSDTITTDPNLKHDSFLGHFTVFLPGPDSIIVDKWYECKGDGASGEIHLRVSVTAVENALQFSENVVG